MWKTFFSPKTCKKSYKFIKNYNQKSIGIKGKEKLKEIEINNKDKYT